MKKIISVVLLTVLLCQAAVFAHPFTDVAGHWAESEIEKAYERNVISGDGDGTFRPDDSISRGEFLKMLTAAVSSALEVEIPAAADENAHWAQRYYDFSLANNMHSTLTEAEKVGDIIPGEMSAESFDLPIERWEMAYLLASFTDGLFDVMQTTDSGDYADKADVEASYSAQIAESVSYCVKNGLIKGDENGMFNAADGGTRAEAATLVNRMNTQIDIYLAAYDAYVEQQKKAMEEQQKKLEETRITYDEIPTGHPVATIEMEDGKKIEIELYPEYAPQTVANFVALAKKGFYDGLTFHRVVDGFMAQGGDPSGDGTGGSGNSIVGEFSSNGFEENTLKHEKGVISMARSYFPDSASSQFFICLDATPSLDGQYAAFGKVISGMEVVEAFAEVEMAENSMGEMASPVTPIVMKKVTVK